MFTITNFLADKLLSYQTSDQRESITRMDDRCIVRAGGFVPESTHYARLKASVNIPIGTRFWMTAEIELPPDFYEKKTASAKIITAGDSVDGYTRFGLWSASDNRFRLQTEVKGASDPLITLLQGDKPLPLGRHFYALEMIASPTDGQALIRLYVDGIVWGETTKANYWGGIINRLVIGIDGAASQNSAPITMTIWRVGLDDYEPVDPCAAKRERLERAKAEKKAAWAEWVIYRDKYQAARDEYLAALDDMGEC